MPVATAVAKLLHRQITVYIKNLRLSYCSASFYLAVAAGDKKYGNDNEPNNVVVVKKVAKAVIHKEFLQKFLRAFASLLV